MTDPTARLEQPRAAAVVLWQDVGGLVLLAAGSLGIGFVINGLRPHPLPLVYLSPRERLGEAVGRIFTVPSTNLPPEPVSARWRRIGLDDFQEFVAARRGLVIDARSTIPYRAGHVPGAISLPREDFGDFYAKVARSLEPAKETPAVVYCSEADCKDSELVAEALSRLGYQRLSIYQEGWEEWSRAGLPQEVGDPH